MVCGVAIVVVGFNVIGCGMFLWKLSRPPLIVDGDLRQLRKIEAMADVDSVNLLIPDMWSRLWANAFLLRKAQYFPTHTYEGRLNTPLKGMWDLEGGGVAVHPGEGRRRDLSPRFALVDTQAPGFVRIEPGDGWHAEEHDPRSGERWRWTKGTATLRVHNPQAQPLLLQCEIDGWSVQEREVTLGAEGEAPGAPATIKPARGRVVFPAVRVPPGESFLVLGSPTPPIAISGDPRPLGVCVFRLHVTARR
jgi:hypothetical protein